MTDLLVNLRLRAYDGVTAVTKRVTVAIGEIGSAAKRAQEVSKNAADLRAAQQMVSGFATKTREALLGTVDASDRFEDSLALLSAASGGLDTEQLATARNAINDLVGATRGFDDEQMVGGMRVLADAGFNAAQQIAAMGPAAKLAQATGADLAATVGASAKVLRGYALEAGQMGRVTDVLRAGAGEAGLTIEAMGAIMGKVAPRAKGLGATVEETAALVAGLGKAGVEGAELGTAVEELMKRIASPKGATAAGFKNLGIDPTKGGPLAVMQALAARTAGRSASEREAGFGAMFETAGASVARLVDAVREGRVNLGQLSETMRSSGGTVDRLAAQMGGTGAASSERLGDAWSLLRRTIGGALSPAMERLRGVAADALEGLVGFARENPGIVKALALTAAAVAGVATLVSGALSLALGVVAVKSALVFVGGFQGIATLLGGAVVSSLKLVLLPLKALAAGLVRTAVAALPVAAPFLAIAVAVGAVTLAIQQLAKHWDQLNFLESIKGIAASLGESGILSTLGELFDPRTLLRDVGIMEGERIQPGAGAQASSSTVNGSIAVTIDSEGRPRVNRVDANGGIELDVSTGYTLAGAAGGL